MDRDDIARPIHKHFFIGAVFLAEDHILVAAPAIVQFAEAAVAITVRLGFAVFFPHQLQCQVFVRLQLAPDPGEVRQRPNGPAGSSGRGR
jgi:hypothetical protein